MKTGWQGGMIQGAEGADSKGNAMSCAPTKARKKTLREREEERADFSGGKRRMTARDLLNSGLVGLWKDRTDIKDSVSFARELRKRASHRRACTEDMT